VHHHVRAVQISDPTVRPVNASITCRNSDRSYELDPTRRAQVLKTFRRERAVRADLRRARPCNTTLRYRCVR
jgi:hypothetical protein